MIKDKLQIVLVTYNRKDFLEKTLNQLFLETSPIKDFDITILNNDSTDGSTELINDFCTRHNNLTHIQNKINIGGNANITKAYTEFLNKDYIWVICDNDTYNWNAWNEVETAIISDYDAILIRHCEDNISEIFHEANFAPSCIYKTKNITNSVVANMYDNIRFMFPHLAIMAKIINENKETFIVTKNIVEIGVNPELEMTYVRDRDVSTVPLSRKKMFWSVGFFNSIELITDRKNQISIIDNLKHFHKNLFELFMSIIIYNNLYENGYSYNLSQIYRILSFSQKIRFILAFIAVKLSFKNYKYWFLRYENGWTRYLSAINEKDYINRLSKRLKNKKVLIYGAGLVSKILFENYDLSKLNVVGISDRRFENSEDEYFNKIKIIKPEDIANVDFDVILFALKEYKKIEKSLKEKGINKKCYSLIKSSIKYALRV